MQYKQVQQCLQGTLGKIPAHTRFTPVVGWEFQKIGEATEKSRMQECVEVIRVVGRRLLLAEGTWDVSGDISELVKKCRMEQDLDFLG